MSAENAAREALRNWVADKNGNLVSEDIADDFPLLKERVITSLQVTDLLLFIEELRGTPVNVKEISPGAFASIDAICDTFLKGAEPCV